MRKIINIFLAVAVMSTQAFTYDIMEEATVLIAEPASLETTDKNGHTLSTSYYSGGGSVRFDFLEPPEPFFTFTPPSIEAGCNGIDIKGMFFNLLGIDQMGEMISNAGASLAYGVAVGLIYSLPGIANAFSFIRKWATEIQQLLANACSAGIKIGMALGDSVGSNLPEATELLNKWQSFTEETVPGYFQKGISGVMESLGIADLLTGSVPESPADVKNESVVAIFKGALQSDSSMLGLILTDLAMKTKASGAQFENLVVTKNIEKAVTTTTFSIVSGTGTHGTKGETDYLVSVGALSKLGTGSLTGKDMIRLNLFAYVLMFNFIGDIGISAPPQGAFENLFAIADSADKKSGPGSDPDVRKRTQDEFAKSSKVNLVATTLVGRGAGVTPEAAGKNLANYIWMGTSAKANRAAGRKPGASGDFQIKQNGKLYAPKATIYTLTLPNTPKKAFIPVLRSDLKSNQLFFNSTTDKAFKGVLDQSTCIIDSLVDGNGTVASSCGSVPFVYPEMHKYVKVIKNSPIYEKPRLKNILILSMAANMANALLYSIDNSYAQLDASESKLIKEYGTGSDNDDVKTKGVTAKKTAALMMQLIEKKNEAMAVATKIIREELSSGFELRTKIEGIFTKQAVKNRERGLKSLQK